MTNEWGAPLTGEEMKALKGRIDPEVLVTPQKLRVALPYKAWDFYSGRYCLPANHPYYKVREYNQKHGTNLVLHNGSAKVPEDWDEDGRCLYRDGGVLWIDTGPEDWAEIIAYTPKPKESEVRNFTSLEDLLDEDGIREEITAMAIKANEDEKMPKDEAIEYVLRTFGYTSSVEQVKVDPWLRPIVFSHARLIQQYEPDRLKPAVDVAAEEYAAEDREVGSVRYICSLEGFKAGAAWQKENGNG